MNKTLGSIPSITHTQKEIKSTNLGTILPGLILVSRKLLNCIYLISCKMKVILFTHKIFKILRLVHYNAYSVSVIIINAKC
jgi:hypothetical protein